ncbi:hypothetical protein K9D38_003077 [Salmonella enterica]|nr:hypothetical protein [Salmonella enterica]
MARPKSEDKKQALLEAATQAIAQSGIAASTAVIVFMSDEYRAFGDGLFLALAETTMDFAARDPARAGEYIALGFEAMWRALTREEQ